jgi:glucose/arabinose dehydrogenase
LLSVAFHPRYAQNHLFYVDYTDTNGDTRVVEYRSDGTRAIDSSARQLFFEKQPFPNHNGGQLAFGPDGMLYIGMGDGGSGGDPNNNGQTFTNKLAKIWKMNVNATDPQPVLAEYGLRNPWRFSFDRATGDLYIADVGQGNWEEIDYVPRARLNQVMNFGWAVYEGRAPYDRSRKLDPRGPYRAPIQVYSHGLGCSVTGGFVYRGKARKDLVGRYFYGDYCSGTVWSFKVVKGKVTSLRKERFDIPSLSSFGEDSRGGLYAVSQGGTIYRIAG